MQNIIKEKLAAIDAQLGELYDKYGGDKLNFVGFVQSANTELRTPEKLSYALTHLIEAKARLARMIATLNLMINIAKLKNQDLARNLQIVREATQRVLTTVAEATRQAPKNTKASVQQLNEGVAKYSDTLSAVELV